MTDTISHEIKSALTQSFEQMHDQIESQIAAGEDADADYAARATAYAAVAYADDAAVSKNQAKRLLKLIAKAPTRG